MGWVCLYPQGMQTTDSTRNKIYAPQPTFTCELKVVTIYMGKQFHSSMHRIPKCDGGDKLPLIHIPIHGDGPKLKSPREHRQVEVRRI